MKTIKTLQFKNSRLQGCHMESKLFSQTEVYKHYCNLLLPIAYLQLDWVKPMQGSACILGECQQP